MASFRTILSILNFLIGQELKRERAKAAATIKSLQEKMEEKLRMELEQKVHFLVFFCKKQWF